MNGSDNSTQIKHGKAFQTGSDSASKSSIFTCERMSIEISNEAGLESRKMRPNFYQIQSVLNVDLDMEFAETVSKNPSLKLQVERPEDNLCIFEDDLFYEGINLDALEEEAAQLLRCITRLCTTKSLECSKQKIASPDCVPQNPGILGSPSFDLGI